MSDVSCRLTTVEIAIWRQIKPPLNLSSKCNSKNLRDTTSNIVHLHKYTWEHRTGCDASDLHTFAVKSCCHARFMKWKTVYLLPGFRFALQLLCDCFGIFCCEMTIGKIISEITTFRYKKVRNYVKICHSFLYLC